MGGEEQKERRKEREAQEERRKEREAQEERGTNLNPTLTGIGTFLACNILQPQIDVDKQDGAKCAQLCNRMADLA